jgi:hypothetical protein
MTRWWEWNHEVELGGHDQNDVEDFTGRIPLFLKECVVKGEKDEKGKIILENNPFFNDVYLQVITFETELQADCAGIKTLNRYVYYNRSTHITSLTSLDTLAI